MATIERRPAEVQQLRQRHKPAAAAAPLVAQQPAARAVASAPSLHEFDDAVLVSQSPPLAQHAQHQQAAPVSFHATSVQFTPYPQLGAEGGLELAHVHQADRIQEAVPAYPGGLMPSAPSFSQPLRLEEYGAVASVSPEQEELLERRPLLSSDSAAASSTKSSVVIQTQSGPRPLSPASLKRLEILRAKARLAEAEADAMEKAIKRGEVAPPRPDPVQMVQHRVELGDDLTDLAVQYGTTVGAIRAANSRVLVFEQSIDNVAGQLITIPATRERLVPNRPPPEPVDPAEVERKRRQTLVRAFRAEASVQVARGAGSAPTEEEARFYLDDSEWDVQAALEQWRDDNAWESNVARSSGAGRGAAGAQPSGHAMHRLPSPSGSAAGRAPAGYGRIN